MYFPQPQQSYPQEAIESARIKAIKQDKNKKINFFKHPGTDPYFIVNGIYPRNNVIVTHYDTQTPTGIPYNYNPDSRTQHPV
ncbi:hypothetical protein BB559_002846 [Furculomyces boomerangus]|uniref:Uncharacterized protein n=1 Tax=Furculomyces boomerangus TaxID=61424 RepID=A0A2T9YRS5_9FUNG|nr:hypothetical protein BB559_002846 [Furculomyces boomerangus]